MTLALTALTGIGEVRAGDDLATLIGDAYALQAPADGDILAVTSKIVSKAEGRIRPASEREAAIDEESVRLVASREHPGGRTRIVQHRLGFVMAAAGVDGSNTAEGTLLLLPLDPDGTCLALAAALRDRFGVRVGIVMTDTFGRPWRSGQTDVAIGAAGVRVIDSLIGQTDAQGRPLLVTAPAIADEIAAAADLVSGKTSANPVVLVRGLSRYVADLDEPGACRLVRDAASDMFRLGSDEAYAEGVRAGIATVQEPQVPDFTTADLYDELGERLMSLPLQLRQFGGLRAFAGPVRTLRVLHDNALVRQMLSTPGNGAVLVIDGAGSVQTALVGDHIAKLAVDNGWAGIVVNGAIRDSVEIGTLPIGVKALGTNPRKSAKEGVGEIDVAVTIDGITIRPGSTLWSDDDGILVEP